MNEDLNCGGADFGCPAAYDVDMCEDCPRDSYCYRVHEAFLRGELKKGEKYKIKIDYSFQKM